MAALGLAIAPRAQQASFTTFGTACQYAGNIGAVGLPQLGGTFSVVYLLPNSPHARFLILGTQQANALLSLPLRRQPSDCYLYTTPDVLVPMPIVGGAWSTAWTVTIPNTPALLGATLFAQWEMLVTQCWGRFCGTQAVVTSDGARIVVGR